MRAVRLIMMLIVAALSVFSYCTERTVNPITGEEQHVGLTPEQEVAMGVQVAPEMARRFGGIDRDERLRQTRQGRWGENRRAEHRRPERLPV